jgi:phenylalanyl-tRNA synthetase beta chain
LHLEDSPGGLYMANVKFSRKEFEKSLGSTINEKIQDQIQLFGTPLESLTAEEIELEIFPDRPDLLSFQNYLRAFKAFLGKSPEQKSYSLEKPQKNYKVKIDPSVKSVRPFTACAIVKNLSFDDQKIKEVIDLQEKLHTTIGRNRKKLAIGIYPLEKISLPIKYEARHPDKIKFTPLESQKELYAQQILTKIPTGRDYAHLLQGKDKYPVFVDANNKILSMPPIINSHETGKITKSTKDIFIECSGFSLPVLQKTLNIIITTFLEMSSSIKVYQMTLEYGTKKIITPDFTPETLQISLENTNNLLGLSLTESQLSKLLPKMELSYEKGKVIIPPWRSDILHEVDIAEDIAIAYGYDSFKPQIPQVATIASEAPFSKFQNKISEILIGLGLLEISTYHLIKQEEVKLARLKNPIQLEDSKTDYKFLRPNLLIPSLRILAENKDALFPQKIFEQGIVFSHSEEKETKIKETPRLLILSSPANFTDMKQILDYLAKSLNIKLELVESTHSQLIEGRTANIHLKEKSIGYVGELHPRTLNTWNINMPCSVIEISLDDIYNTL